MNELTVYSRRGCHLCDDLLEELQPLIHGKLPFRVVDIDRDPVLRELYNDKVPVLMFQGAEICRYQLDRQALLNVLAATEHASSP